jgi:hypothetical protein
MSKSSKSSAKRANTKTARDVKSSKQATKPSARASSAREDRSAAEDRHARAAARPDPTELSPEQRGINTAAAESNSPYTRNNPPGPQVGPSSSELNTVHPARKDELVPEQEGPGQSPEKK